MVEESMANENEPRRRGGGACQAPRGTRDILPQEIGPWHAIEDACRSVLECAGYREIRTPMFEHTELFERGIGETTDIVEKEMYTFTDRAGRSLTLRPEGTASAVRAYLQHKMYAGPRPVKLYYIGPMFRYERPQAGRYREFWQFGAEAIGARDPAIDAELVEVLIGVLRGVGLDGFDVRINSLGCPVCRPRYRASIYEALQAKRDALCPDCQRRLERNPLRVLDCKGPRCREVTRDIVSIFGHLCEDCRAHFEALKRFLDAGGIAYSIDERIVRGLDYYTRTVFEVIHKGLGAQDALGGGGRYDGLVEECGGPPTPGAGFAAGMDRIVQVMAGAGLSGREERGPSVFFAALGDEARLVAFKAAMALRKNGIPADMDYLGRGLKAQMKFADKVGSRYAVIAGPDELAAGEVVVREMATGDQVRVSLGDLVSELMTMCCEVEKDGTRL